MFAKFWDITSWDDEKRKIYQNVNGVDGLSKNLNNWLNQLATLKSFIPENILQEIQRPTLILHGDRDTIIDHQHGAYFKKKIQNSKIWMLKTDHNILNNQHKEVNRKIHQFLLDENTDQNQNSAQNQISYKLQNLEEIRLKHENQHRDKIFQLFN